MRRRYFFGRWPGSSFESISGTKAEAELSQQPLNLGVLESWLDDKDVWSWPASVTPGELYRWADTETPMLLLNGTLDGQTHVDGVRPAA